MLWRRLEGWFAPAPDPARIGWLGEALYAHRGLHGGGVVENSATAFTAAVTAGVGIECDVQQTADGQALVFHDWSLERLTDQAGPVLARTAAELARIPLRGSTDRPRTLPRLLAEVAGRVPLLIELKSRRSVAYEPLCRAVAADLAGYPSRVAVMSFDPRIVRWFAVNARHLVRGLVVTERDTRTWRGSLRRHAALWQAGPDFLAYDVRDLPSRFAARQRRRGLPVLTWTVSDAARLATATAHADAPIAEGSGLELALRNA